MTAAGYDVVVVGAGPTGFTLAIDLGRRGVRTLLIEKDPSTKQWPKMDRSNARTMEFYRRLGFADRVRALGYPAEASMDVFIVTRLSDPSPARLHYQTVAEHRERIAASTDGSEPLERYQLVSQNDLEPLLKEIAESTPNVAVRFGCELVGFEQDADGVDVHVRDLESGDETLRSSYLAGCDGGRSFVRKTLGIPLEGRVFLAGEAVHLVIPTGGLGNVAEWDTRSYTPHTRPGVRIPHVWLGDGRAVQDALGPDYNLVDLTGAADTAALEAEFAHLGAPLQVLRIADPHAAEVYEASLLLLRPDLHVYWRGDQLPEDVMGLAQAATGHQGSFPVAPVAAQQPAVAR